MRIKPHPTDVQTRNQYAIITSQNALTGFVASNKLVSVCLSCFCLLFYCCCLSLLHSRRHRHCQLIRLNTLQQWHKIIEIKSEAKNQTKERNIHLFCLCHMKGYNLLFFFSDPKQIVNDKWHLNWQHIKCPF